MHRKCTKVDEYTNLMKIKFIDRTLCGKYPVIIA